mmetsp:Transcript_51889/g.155724  ORF Transcript_51889/g.155724 Transcript_51889/m.155724 type:complete len:168 (+) Transcript_51889:1926-2429(+)
MVTFEHPTGDCTINDFDLAVHVGQIRLMCPQAQRRAHIYNNCNNTATTVWVARSSISWTGPAAALLRKHALFLQQHEQASTLLYLADNLNRLAGDETRLWHLSHSELLHHFNSSYPKYHSWELCQLPSSTKKLILTNLRYKHIRTERPASREPATPPGDSGASSLPG